jgi:signal transduction histidine kinase
MATEVRPRDDRYVFSSRWRSGAAIYVGVTALGAALAATLAVGENAYLTAWAAVPALYVAPAVVATRTALRYVSPKDRLAWRLWCLGWCVIYSGGVIVYLVAVRDWDVLRWTLLVAVVVGELVFGVANTAALHRRGGQRALLIDLVDLTTTVLVVVGPVVLLVGEAVVTSKHSWLTLPSMLVVLGIVHGCTTFALIYVRIPPERRDLVRLGIVFCLLGLVDASAQVAQGITDFGLPSGPLVGVHALCMGGGLFIALFAVRRSSTGLDRFPPQQQVRKNGVIAVVVLVAVVIMGVEVVWRREHGWVLAVASVMVLALLVLSTVRQLLLARETVRLYGEVERAAAERRELLGEVMRSVDSDRHRAAVHLHGQAASLYVAMASFAQAVDRVQGDDVRLSVGRAAERVRVDLAQRVDASQQIVAAIQPNGVDRDREGLPRLVALTRAYVGNLWGDLRRPDIAITVDDRLVVDWTHEVVMFRVIELAVHNVWRHADARSITVDIGAPDDTLTVRIADDGNGFDPDEPRSGTGVAAMRTLAAFLHGHVDIDASPGHGTRVHAVLAAPAPAAGPPAVRPQLRLVPGTN